MRRPGPLPTPPPPSDAADVDAAPEVADWVLAGPTRAVAAAGGAPAPVADAGGEAFESPSTADTGRAPVRPARPAQAGSGPAPDEGDPTADDRVGVREVWAAARARRKALRAEVRRFTARQRRRRRIWLGAGAAIVILVLGTLGAAYSPLFAVERVRVVGTTGLDAAAVEAALAGQVGTPLPLVDSSAVKAALVGFPLVESYTLEARPPHELVVRIVERTPVGAIASTAGYTLVDAAGVALSTTPEAPAGHPLLEVQGGADSRAFDAVGTVYRSLPDGIRAQVTQLSATTPSDVSFVLGATNTTVVWGTAGESARKAIVLEATMAKLRPDQVDTYDVSSPGAVVIR